MTVSKILGSGLKDLTDVNTSLTTLNSSLTTLQPIAQGSTTSGQSGSLIQAAVVKGAVSYTTAQTSPLVLDPNGSLYSIGGNIGVITRDNKVLASDGAQTDAALLSVSTGTRIVLTQISAVCDARNTVNAAVRVGFGTANVPAASLAGTAGIVLDGIYAAGGGQQKGNGSGIIAVGADGEDLRLTCDSPTSGAIYISYSYYTVAA
jgi:hypothetical protein